MRFGCWPIATSTIIVSPTAREIASTNDAMIPETAAGTTIRVATCTLVEPSAYAPSRRSRGTAPIASSESEATVGISITPMTRPAESVLKMSTWIPMSRSSGVMNVSAK